MTFFSYFFVTLGYSVDKMFDINWCLYNTDKSLPKANLAIELVLGWKLTIVGLNLGIT